MVSGCGGCRIQEFTLAECPFCGSGASEDLITYGGTCPKCFAEVPGEEAPTDPGEEVRAIQERGDRRRAGVRAAVGLLAMTMAVTCTGLTAILFVLWPEPEVIEIVDFDTIDYPMPEVVLSPNAPVVASAGNGTTDESTQGAGATANGASSGNPSTDGTSVASTSGGRTGTDRASGGASSGGGSSSGSTAGLASGGDSRLASVSSSGGASSSGGLGGASGTDAAALAEGFAPSSGGPSGTGVGGLGGDPDARSTTGLGPRSMGERPSEPTRIEGPKATSTAGIGGLGIDQPKVSREDTVVYRDRDGIVMMIGDHMVEQIPMLNVCYERQLKANPSLQGRWRLIFTVTRAGRVSGASAVGVNNRSSELEDCIVDLMESKWRFARIVDDVPVRRTLTFRPN